MSMPLARNHTCQTPECENLAAVVLVRLDDSTVDIMCDTCLMAMMVAVAMKIPDTVVTPLPDPEPVV